MTSGIGPLDRRGPVSQVLVDNVGHIRILQVSMVAPDVAAAKGIVQAGGGAINGMVFTAMPGCRHQPLLEHGARHAFRNLTMKQLRDLITVAELVVPRPLPRSEHELVAACIRAVIPDIEDAEIAAIIEQHRVSKAPQPVWGSVLKSTNLAHIDGLLDADAAKAVRHEVHAREVADAVSEAPGSVQG